MPKTSWKITVSTAGADITYDGGETRVKAQQIVRGLFNDGVWVKQSPNDAEANVYFPPSYLISATIKKVTVGE